MYKSIQNSGFQEDVYDEKDYVFGSQKSLGQQEILAPDGQWDAWKPTFEIQKNPQFDTWSCTNFAFTNALEFIHKRRYEDENNRSERFSALTSGTKPRQGNSIKNPSEAARTMGTVADATMPFLQTMTEAQYFNKADLTKPILDEGLKWLEDYNFGYEKIQDLKNDRVMDTEIAMEALKYSPLQTGIDSSTKNKTNFRGWNDSVVIYGCEYGKRWKVFGSYPSTTGDYDWDYPFYSPNKFYLRKKVELVNVKNMQLIKGANSPKIYWLDSDNRKHHLELEPDFYEYMGNRAFSEQLWEVLSQDIVDNFEEGMSISVKKRNGWNRLTELIQTFGSKF